MPAVFQIVPVPFSDKDGTVNSTMKIVRHRIASIYSELIEYSFTPKGSNTNNDRNRETLGKMFNILETPTSG